MALILTLLIGAGGAVWWNWRSLLAASHAISAADSEDDSPDREFAAVYERLKVAPLPRRIATDAWSRKSLLALRAEPCDRYAAVRLVNALQARAARRAAAETLIGYADSCPGAEDLRVSAAETYYALADFPAALATAQESLRQAPDAARPLLVVARSLKGLGRADEALTVLARLIAQQADPGRVPSELFVLMSDLYAGLARYCEAVAPIETFVAARPERSSDAEMRARIDELRNKGRCDAAQAKGDVRLPRLRADVLTAEAEIDGVKGRFLLDTGATFVTVSRAFAQRARLAEMAGAATRLQTANGVVPATLATAQKIRLGRIETQAVPTVIVTKDFGRDMDGVLGMSFLSRFDMSVSDREWRISTKAARK